MLREQSHSRRLNRSKRCLHRSSRVNGPTSSSRLAAVSPLIYWRLSANWSRYTATFSITTYSITAPAWLAIDPKGQFGERTYDFVNIFRNPLGTIGNDPVIFSRRMSQIAQCARLDPRRLRRWIVAFCALCLVWDYYPEGTSASDRQLAHLALEHIE